MTVFAISVVLPFPVMFFLQILLDQPLMFLWSSRVWLVHYTSCHCETCRLFCMWIFLMCRDFVLCYLCVCDVLCL